MSTQTFTALWQKDGFEYNQTELELEYEPNSQEAAQLIAIKEDIDVTSVKVDAVKDLEAERAKRQ